MRDDLKAAIRSLRSSKSFSIAALILLTLAIGASTALFSVVDAVVLRGLPFDMVLLFGVPEVAAMWIAF